MKKLKNFKKVEDVSSEDTEYSQAQAKKLGRMQFILVILLFVAVICVTELVSMFIGKIAGTVALAIIAAAIAAYLYRAEIKKWLKKK